VVILHGISSLPSRALFSSRNSSGEQPFAPTESPKIVIPYSLPQNVPVWGFCTGSHLFCLVLSPNLVSLTLSLSYSENGGPLTVDLVANALLFQALSVSWQATSSGSLDGGALTVDLFQLNEEPRCWNVNSVVPKRMYDTYLSCRSLFSSN
jgi:hypothetical protein